MSKCPTVISSLSPTWCVLFLFACLYERLLKDFEGPINYPHRFILSNPPELYQTSFRLDYSSSSICFFSISYLYGTIKVAFQELSCGATASLLSNSSLIITAPMKHRSHANRTIMLTLQAHNNNTNTTSRAL